MKTTTNFTMSYISKKLLALLLSLFMVVNMLPVSYMTAHAETISITGETTIDSNGTYQLESGATGVITIDPNLEVTLIGLGSTTAFSGLSINVGDGTTLTIQDFYANQPSNLSTINYVGSGALNIAGTNQIDNDGGLNDAVIRIVKGYTLTLGGTGTLYGYKSSLCSYIGGGNGQANGAITFNSGHWFLKGTKTGAVIGSDSTSEAGGKITINGGELYIKGVARGALIGASNQGKSGDVYINGGLIELFEDFTGPAIGSGNAANAGNLYVNGGSIKTVASSNSHNSKGESAAFKGLPSVSWDAVQALNASEYALLPIDVTNYGSAITVKVDGNSFYSGGKYTYVTNEVKNPTAAATTGAISDTQSNWLNNDSSWHVTSEDYGTSAYPSKSGAYLAPENNIYLALSKENHTITVNGDNYDCTWDETSGAFTLVKAASPWDGTTVDTSWYNSTDTTFTIDSAEKLAGFASLVTGGNTFEGKTVKVSKDIDVNDKALNSIGDETNVFNGTFDGQGHTISKFTITSDKDVAGFFAATGKSAVIKNLTLSGSVTSTATSSTTAQKMDGVGALVGVNRGVITNVYTNVNVTATNMYNVGGLVGWNSGKVNQWSDANRNASVLTNEVNNGDITACVTTGNVTGDTAVGGIAGHNSGNIDSCLAFGIVDGDNSSSKNGVGGIVGRNGNNNTAYETGVINSCAFYGTVGRTGQKWVGGIAGFCSGAYGNANCVPSSVTNCYMAGTLASSGTGYDNQIVGNLEGTSTNNYAVSTAGNTGSTVGEIGTQTTAAALKSQAMATNLSIGTRWVFATESDAIYSILNSKGFAGYTVPVALTSNSATVTGTTWSGSPKLEYTEGQTFDMGDLSLLTEYSDGSQIKNTLTADKSTISLDDNGKTVTVSNSDKTASKEFTLTVTANAVASIALYSTYSNYTPNCTVYAPGESFDLTGLKLKVTYTNGLTETVTFGSELPEGWKTNISSPLTAADNGKTFTLTYTLHGVETTYDTSSVSGKTVIISVLDTPVQNDGYYELDSVDDLTWFAAQVNQRGHKDINAKLTKNIDLSGVNYTPIGTSTNSFAGTLDGNGKTITFSDATTFTTTSYNGVFGYLGAGTVKDLTVDGAVKVGSSSGAVVGYVNGDGTISGCTNKANITAIGTAGGILGYAGVACTIKDCKNLGNITASGSNIGGIVGSSNNDSVNISNCANHAVITASSNAGGILGNGKGQINSCLNKGNITATTSTTGVAGGILGGHTSTSTGLTVGKVTNCANKGTVTGGKAGGIVGSTYKSAYENCYNTGAVTCTGTSATAAGAGGLLGIYTSNSAGATFTNCYNAGTVTGTVNSKALIGYDTKGAKLTNCYYLDSVATTVWGGTKASTTGYAVKTETEMKSADFVTSLGSAYIADTYKSNNEYPILSWQVCDHKLTHHDKVEVGCLTDGCKEYWTCDKCNDVFSDSEGKTSTTLDALKITAQGHTLTHHEKVDANCTTDGCKEYWTCSGCEGIFSDSEGQNATTLDALKISKLNHQYDTNGFCTECGNYNPDATGYTISTAAQLKVIADGANNGDNFKDKTITLANDIDLSGINWSPIGGSYTKHDLTLSSQDDLDAALLSHFIIYDNTTQSYVQGSEKNGKYDSNRTYYYVTGAPFAGIFDGNNHSINNLNVDTQDGYAGLFGNVDGTVKNLTVNGSVTSTTTQDYVGGIVGKLSAGGTISNCVSNVAVTGLSGFNIGGIVGFVGEPGQMVSETNKIATVENCINNGEVKGNVRVGGIAGRNAGMITKCANHGAVFNGSGAKKGTGGIVGMNGVNNAAADAGIVTNCYNDAYVNGNKGFWTGGIAGFQNAASTTSHCYNAGTLYAAASATATSLYSWVNPIVGQNEGTVNDCLWLNKSTTDNTKSYVGKDPTGVGNAGGTVTNIVSKTSDELSQISAVEFLGTEFKSQCGYPVLSFEQGLAHGSLTHHDAAAVQCTTDGYKEYWTCDNCGQIFSDSTGTTPTTLDALKITTQGHSLTLVDRVEPQYNIKGNIAYYVCTSCNKKFADINGSTELTDAEIEIPALLYKEIEKTSAETVEQEAKTLVDTVNDAPATSKLVSYFDVSSVIAKNDNGKYGVTLKSEEYKAGNTYIIYAEGTSIITPDCVSCLDESNLEEVTVECVKDGELNVEFEEPHTYVAVLAIHQYETTSVYRLYNPGLGVHHYTSDKKEKDNLIAKWGWKDEGIAFTAYVAGDEETTAVYRLYNPALSQHLLTSDLSEVKNLTSKWGWKLENNGKPCFYLPNEDSSTTNIYRLYNPYLRGGEHLYTTDKEEYDRLVNYQWDQEGVAFYGVSDN